MIKRITSAYLWMSAAILAATAVAKLVAWAHGGQYWDAAHVYFKSVTNGRLMQMGIVVEVAALACLAFVRGTERKLTVLTWTGICFGLFKATMFVLGVRGPCRCIGGMLLSPEAERFAANAIIAWLLLGGLALLFAQRARTDAADPRAAENAPSRPPE